MSEFSDIFADGTPPPPTETPKVEPTVEVVVEPIVENAFDFDAFNKTFGGEYKDVDSIKGVFEKASKYDEVFTEREQYSKRVSELEGIEGKVDPLSFFSSPDAYLKEQFRIKNASMDESVLNVISGFTPSSIENLEPLKALTVQMLASNPTIDGGEEGVTELLADKYGVSIEELDDFANLDRKTKNKINLDVKSAKAELKKMYEGIDVPQKVDLTQMRTDVKTAWESPLKEIVKGIDKLKLAEGLEFIVTDEMKAGILEERLSKLSNNLIKPSQEVGEQLSAKIRKELLVKNMDKIVQFIDKASEEKWKSHFRAEVHNTAPLNDTDREAATGKSFSDWLDRN